MRVVCDIEANGLSPTRIWCIVCKDIDSGIVSHFVGDDIVLHFPRFAREVTLWIGHNFLGYDLWALNSLVKGVSIHPVHVVDTLIVSRYHNFRRDGGHSLEAWGETLGYPKVKHSDWSQFSEEMLDRCKTDVEINYRVYEQLKDVIFDKSNSRSLRVEHDTAVVCWELKTNGFTFNYDKAKEIHKEISDELASLYGDIQQAFPQRAVAVREVVPRSTKAGTLHAGDFRWIPDGDLTPFSPGAAFTRIEWRPFNPASPKQVVERFNEFGWAPYVKTDGHADAERELRTLQRTIRTSKFLPVGRLIELRNRETELLNKLVEYETYGWKISEENLATLPSTSPEAAWLLIKWKLLEKRRQTLEEWFAAYSFDTGRIHGNFNGIGTWTHRFSHSNPNMGNVPSTDSKYNSEDLKEKAKYYGTKLRSLWGVPRKRKLVGVDAEGIQLRVLAHYIDDPEFTDALVNGVKEEGTDIHTVNAIKLGLGPKGRSNSKTFIYAWLLGAGLVKIAKILDTDLNGARTMNQKFLDETPGLKKLKEYDIPNDVERGYFIGLDGRKIPCDNDHLMLAGYLQNGESVVMKHATQMWRARLIKERIPFKLVNYVHDEWQTETDDDDDIALYIAEVQKNAIVQTGIELNMKCPLAGSHSLGYDWYTTH